MGPLRVSGTTSRQLRRYVAQLGHTIGVVKPGGGMNTCGKGHCAKRTAFKAWKAGKGTMASYDAAKRNARHVVHQACQEADKKVYENIDPKSSEVYCLANQFRRENTDVVGDKPVKNDAGEMSMSEDSKQKAWLEHYQKLLDIEFDWDPDHLLYQPPVEGPPIPITIDMVKKAISQMKAGKAPGLSGIVVEMIRAANDMGASMIHDLAAAIIRDGKEPSDWEQSFIVCLYKGKGDALERGNYRGLKLTEQVMKILERIVDGLIRELGVNRQFPVWLRSRQWHYRCNLCC